MKYIDAEKLKAEIERLKDEYTDIAIDSHYGTVNANSVVDDLERLLSLTDTLQQEQPQVADASKMEQPEIDFEQALYKHFGQVKDFTLGMRIAAYFYELGLNARKED